MKTVLDKIIGQQQMAYIQGRRIAECTHITYDIFNHAKVNNFSGMMLMIDLKKLWTMWIFGS